MKTTSLLLPAAAAALIATAILAATAGVQAAQSAAPADPSAPAAPTAPQGHPAQGGRPARNYPAPTNLQVLPKDLTGRQVRDIMETFAGSLGVECEFCHTRDPKNVGPNGRPRTNFADDSKPDKQIARIMYTMTMQMNKDYISKAMVLDTDHEKDDMGPMVTCGTCHRGHKMPDDFVIPPEEHSGGPGAGPGGPPPATSTPPPSH